MTPAQLNYDFTRTPNNEMFFHVAEFIFDEACEARGWSLDELAERMGGDSKTNRCVLDLLTLRDPRCFLDRETADGLSRAFGTGWELWMNLDASWHKQFEVTQC